MDRRDSIATTTAEDVYRVSEMPQEDEAIRLHFREVHRPLGWGLVFSSFHYNMGMQNFTLSI